ncbi:MAG: RNA polymerase factor sigma-54 [Gammaproteobacteria bacterium]|tara:strand:+ start:11461 stop:12822 length:1362 start_codon:yes stop_codon:yes gene_type:complete
MKLNLSIKNTAKVSITPQLQNAIKLLQYTAVEINQEIQNIFESNPLIEKEDACEDFQEDNCTEHYLHYDKDFSHINTSTISPTEVIERTSYEEDTLQKHLLWQIHLSNLSDNDKSIAESITDYLNNDGYLIKDILDIFDDLYLNTETTIDEVIAVQHFIQSLDPIGTCSKDIQECLLVQVQNKNEDSFLKDKACILLNEFFQEYSENKIKIIRNGLGISEENFVAIDKIIKKQNPRPGNILNNTKNHDYIIPDIQITKDDSDWIIKNNKVVSPDIKINKNYTDIDEKNLSDADKKYVKEKLQEAKLFIKNIGYRNDTLLSLSKRIFEKQRKFFDHGIENLIPMNLKEIAADLGVHESTVSRLTNGKYVETPYGIFELKFFFSSSIKNKDGKNFSSKSIKEKIKKIVSSENKKSPFSDNKIKDILKSEGIDLARRTVSKYRESLNIESSSKRKI